MMNTTKFYAGPSQKWYKGEDSNTSLIYCADGKRTGAVFLADTKQYKLARPYPSLTNTIFFEPGQFSDTLPPQVDAIIY